MEITRDEFYRALDSLKGDLREDLSEIKAQQAITNGRIGKSEVEIGKLDTRMKNTEHEIFRRRRDDDSGAVQTKRTTRPGTGAAWAEDIATKREGRLLGLGIVMLMGAWEAIRLVVKVLWDALPMHKP